MDRRIQQARTKKHKVTPAKTLRKKSIELAKAIAKARDDYQCQKCGKRKDRGWKIDGSHVIEVSLDGRLAADPLNIKALCAQCHIFWHASPVESGEWFRKRFSDRWAYLDAEKLSNRHKGTITRLEWQGIYDNLKGLE